MTTHKKNIPQRIYREKPCDRQNGRWLQDIWGECYSTYRDMGFANPNWEWGRRLRFPVNPDRIQQNSSQLSDFEYEVNWMATEDNEDDSFEDA